MKFEQLPPWIIKNEKPTQKQKEFYALDQVLRYTEGDTLTDEFIKHINTCNLLTTRAGKNRYDEKPDFWFFDQKNNKIIGIEHFEANKVSHQCGEYKTSFGLVIPKMVSHGKSITKKKRNLFNEYHNSKLPKNEFYNNSSRDIAHIIQTEINDGDKASFQSLLNSINYSFCLHADKLSVYYDRLNSLCDVKGKVEMNFLIDITATFNLIHILYPCVFINELHSLMPIWEDLVELFESFEQYKKLKHFILFVHNDCNDFYFVIVIKNRDIRKQLLDRKVAIAKNFSSQNFERNLNIVAFVQNNKITFVPYDFSKIQDKIEKYLESKEFFKTMKLIDNALFKYEYFFTDPITWELYKRIDPIKWFLLRDFMVWLNQQDRCFLFHAKRFLQLKGVSED